MYRLRTVLLTGFVWVMGNLERHGILKFHFPGLKNHEIEVWVMESHGKAVIYFLRIKRQKDQKLEK